MGIKANDSRLRVDNHSKPLNIGLVNVESKPESDTVNEYFRPTWKECVELALAILIVLYGVRALYGHMKKKQTKSSKKKMLQLKTIVEEATASQQPTIQPPFSTAISIQTITLPPVLKPATTMEMKALTNESKQLVPVHVSRIPLFNASLYD